MVIIKRDGKQIAEVADSNAAFAWLLKHQSMSVDWAIKYEGWTVHDGETGAELDEYSKYRH